MRLLTDEEAKTFFKKLSDYLGDNVKYLIERSDEPYVFRLLEDRVYYMSEKIMKLTTNISRDCLLQ